jgi:hypothetical protein
MYTWTSLFVLFVQYHPQTKFSKNSALCWFFLSYVINMFNCRCLVFWFWFFSLQHISDVQKYVFGQYPSSCLCLKRRPEIGTSSIDWNQLSRSYLKTETESSLRNVMFWKVNRTTFHTKTRRWILFKNAIFVLMYRRHKPLDHTYIWWHNFSLYYDKFISVCYMSRFCGWLRFGIC